MESLNKLMQEIINITAIIETDYPELYKYLSETPLSIADVKEKSINSHDLTEYLATLKSQLEHHIETHKKKTK
jgi:hypothetical protein